MCLLYMQLPFYWIICMYFPNYKCSFLGISKFLSNTRNITKNNIIWLDVFNSINIAFMMYLVPI